MKTTKTTGLGLLLLVVAMGLTNCKKDEQRMMNFNKPFTIKMENADEYKDEGITGVKAMYRYDGVRYTAGGGAYKDGMFTIELKTIPESQLKPLVPGDDGITVTPAGAMGVEEVSLVAINEDEGEQISEIFCTNVSLEDIDLDEPEPGNARLEVFLYAQTPTKISGSKKDSDFTTHYRVSLQAGWNIIVYRVISETEREFITLTDLSGYKWYFVGGR